MKYIHELTASELLHLDMEARKENPKAAIYIQDAIKLINNKDRRSGEEGDDPSSK